MKELFDPLVVKKRTLATPAEIFRTGSAVDEAKKKKVAAEEPLRAALKALVGATEARLQEERVQMLPPDVRAAYLKPERQRTVEEQKSVDAYFVPLRVDAIKVKEALPADDQ